MHYKTVSHVQRGETINERQLSNLLSTEKLRLYTLDSERAITGFWTTAELNKALEKGYVINQIYEVLHFENASTDMWKE